MCGIVGYLKFENNYIFDGKTFLEKANKKIFHRGPDEGGEVYFHNERIGLGMRRLSIIDIKHGQQPMHNRNNTHTIIFNGEIYNYEELHDNYLSDFKFDTHSDTEVLLHIFEKDNINCLDNLNGMFGFAIWDDTKQKLTLARDKFGKKPLYYYLDNDILIFGSEIKSILEAPFLSCKISKTAMDNYFRWLAIPEPKTMFEGINKVEPGEYLVFDIKNGLEERSNFWRASFENNNTPISFSDAKDVLLKKFDAAIEKRLHADVPVGILLSGGVDSSAIVARATQFQSNISTYSIGFEDERYNEFEYSRYVADKFNTNHTEITMSARDYWETLPKVVYHLDEPMADTATVALYYICQKAREDGFKVLLSGEGSDEMLAGYGSRYTHGLETLGGLGNLEPYIPKNFKEYAIKKFTKERKIHEIIQEPWFQMVYPQKYRFLLSSIYGFYGSLLESLYKNTPLAEIPVNDELLIKRISSEDGSLLQKMLGVDMEVNLPAYLLMKADKMSMAASIELRCPFLDPHYAKFCFNLPDKYKLNPENKEGKWILKKALEGIFPNSFLYRQKVGFPVPTDEWLRKELKDDVYKLLFNDSKISTIFNYNFIKNMWQAHQGKKQNFGKQLWLLVLMELWLNTFESKITYE